jgi:2-keto-4-pentenoate hydratase/2-oxohepta-3-ene-1,7-dioic acid hydratase in catechol pathway
VAQYIYGYTVINDVTARDIQKKEGQWFRAKSFDTFGPIGPSIVLAKDITNHNNINLKSFVNGQLRQDSNTSEMIFDVDHLISFISKSMSLEEGDMIATGTPAGVGAFMKEKSFLEDKDIITCTIEGIGNLINSVVKQSKAK